MTKVERIFYIINLLRTHSYLKANRISELCEVSGRQIYRDLNTISSVGFPIHFDYILCSYRLQDSKLDYMLNTNSKEVSTLDSIINNMNISKQARQILKGLLLKVELMSNDYRLMGIRNVNKSFRVRNKNKRKLCV